MRVHVLHHACCFDGAASCALFTAFYRTRVDAGAEFVYIPKQHRPGDPFDPSDFDADDVAVVDFRYSKALQGGWYFDHHASAFQLDGEREHFEADQSGHKFFDANAKSCAGLVAQIAEDQFGFDPRPHRELLHWAQIVDSAAFPNPEMPVLLQEPALRLMTFAEQNIHPENIARFIQDLLTVPIAKLADCDYVRETLDPVLTRHQRDIELLRERCTRTRDVVEYVLLDQPPRVYNKFIPYFHHPDAKYLVGVSIGPDGRIKLSAGYNPWLPAKAREHNIAALCERFGGGGHPYVGGVSFDPADTAAASEAQDWISSVLRGDRRP